MKIVAINTDSIIFDDGTIVTSEHESGQSMVHALSFGGLDPSIIDETFDLSTDQFFDKIEGYGLQLRAINGRLFDLWAPSQEFASEDFKLVVTKNGNTVGYDITGCEDAPPRPIEE